METADILKIIVPIILFTLGGIAGLVKWILIRETDSQRKGEQAQQQYWAAVHKSLEKLVEDLSQQFHTHKSELTQRVDRSDARILDVDRRLQEFRELVAGEYIKRDDWLEHAVNLERKVDQLRNDFNKEIKDLIKAIANWRPTHGAD